MQLPGTERLRTLVVEDVSYIRSLICGVLRRFGFVNIVEAGTVSEAISEIRHATPDLIITDWEMPGRSGLDLLKWVRQDIESPNPAVPIILLTSHGDSETVRIARDAGANRFLVKPIAPKRVSEAVQELIFNDRPFVVAPGYVGPDRRRVNRPVPSDRRAGHPAAHTIIIPPAEALSNKINGTPNADVATLRVLEQIRKAVAARPGAGSSRDHDTLHKPPLDALYEMAGEALDAIVTLTSLFESMESLATEEFAPSDNPLPQVLQSLGTLISRGKDRVPELSMITLHLHALRAMTREREGMEAHKIAADLAIRLDKWRREHAER